MDFNLHSKRTRRTKPRLFMPDIWFPKLTEILKLIERDTHICKWVVLLSLTKQAPLGLPKSTWLGLGFDPRDGWKATPRPFLDSLITLSLYSLTLMSPVSLFSDGETIGFPSFNSECCSCPLPLLPNPNQRPLVT